MHITTAYGQGGSRDGVGLPSPMHLIYSKALEAISDLAESETSGKA